jgi:hypothetical protein
MKKLTKGYTWKLLYLLHNKMFKNTINSTAESRALEPGNYAAGQRHYLTFTEPKGSVPCRKI